MNYRCEYRPYRLPFRASLWTGHGRWEAREGVILRLESETGVVGFGDACPIPWFGTETVAEVVEACDQLGETIDDDLCEAVPRSLGCLRGALQLARSERDAPADQAARAMAAFLPAGRNALDLIEAQAEAGFRTFKWKVGVGEVADELALLDDVCARLPSGAKLRLDANGAWDRRAAEKWLDRCADYPVEYVEQPCLAEASVFAKGLADKSLFSAADRKSEDLLLGLAGDFPTPLALDESVVSVQDVSKWLDLGWSGYFVLKTSLMGDVKAALTMLEKADAKVVFSSALETGIGAKAALRFAFGWSCSKHALGFGVWPLFRDQAMDGPYHTPFMSWEDVARIDEEAVWNALS